MLPIRTIVTIAVLTATTAHGETLHSSDIYPADYPTVQAVTYMGKLVSERTGGRLTIESLEEHGEETENYRVAEVRNGMHDMARVNLATLNSIAPSSVVASLPYLFKSTTHLRRVLDGPIGDEMLARMESHGIIGLCFYDMGWRSFGAKKPIRNVADMKSLKVRVQQSDLSVPMLRAMGANPINMPDGRAYVGLQNGVIDATESNLPAYVEWRHYEVARVYSLTQHSMAPGVLIFSKKVWDGLSKKDQTIIRAAAKESVPYMRKLWDEREASALEVAEAAGVQIVTDIDRKSFSDVLIPLYAQVLNNSNLQDVVKRIQAVD